MHKNVNPAIIIPNKTFSEYFVVSNNLYDFPLYAKEHYNLNYDNQKKLCIDAIMQDSIKGYRNSIFATDFSNPFVVIDTLICYFIETQNIRSPKNFFKH